MRRAHEDIASRPLGRGVRRAWLTLLRRSDVRRAVDEELDFHIEMTARRLEGEEGMGPGQARAEAERRFGVSGNYRRDCVRIGQRRRRSRNRTLRAGDLRADISYALRTLRRAPLLVTVTVLSIGVGIGAATTIFAVANAMFYRSARGLGEPEHLVTIYTTGDEGNQHGPMSYLDFEEIRDRVDVLEGVTAFGYDAMTIGDPSARRSILAEVVSGDYFDLLAIRPVVGRTFLPEETVVGSAERVVVISHQLWQREFGGTADVVGSELRLNGHLFTVIGVAPSELSSRLLALRTDAYIPVGVPGVGTRRRVEDLRDRGDRDYTVMARIAEGAEIQGLQSRLDVLATGLAENYPESWILNEERSRAFTLVSEKDSRVNPDSRLGLSATSVFLLATTGLILLIACSNVAGLFLARATRRRKEMAIRISLGASRRRLVTMLLVESLIPGVAAAAFGVILATAAVGSMRSLSLPIDIPLNFDFTVDHRVLIFSLLLGIAASLVFGLAPALEASNPSPATSLKEGLDQRGRRRGGAGRLRSILVMAQIAGSLVFVAGAGLFVRSLGGALELDLGMNPDGVTMMTRSVDREEFSPEVGAQFLRELEARLEARPEVREAVVARAVELTLATAVSGQVAVWTEQMRAEGAESLGIYHNAVGPGYFDLLEIPLLRGRPIMAGDVDGSPPVAVVNQTMAERLWPEQDPIGRRFTMRLQDDAADIRGASEMTLEVVGLARDGLYLEIDEGPMPYFWASVYQTWAPIVTFLVEGGSIEEGVRALQQEVPIPADQLVLAAPSSLRSQIDIQVLHLRIASRVLGWGGLLGLLLAVIGIYGLVAFTVSLRTREMAIRMALGARRAQIVGEVLAGGLRLTLVGLAIGALIVVPLSFAVRSQLYGMSPLDPAALGGSVGVLFVAALVATLVPARRAARNHPMQTLRTE